MSIIATAQIIAAQYVSEQKNVKLGFPCITAAAGAVCSTDSVCMDDEDHIASRL